MRTSTTTQDSTSAVSLLQLLQVFARQHGKTVLTSIHQPSSAVFRSFDRLLLLSDGKTVYFGTPVDSLQYLRQLDMACPDGYNAADHWMDLLVTDSAVEEELLEQQTEEGPAVAGELCSRRRNQGKTLPRFRFLLSGPGANT